MRVSGPRASLRTGTAVVAPLLLLLLVACSGADTPRVRESAWAGDRSPRVGIAFGDTLSGASPDRLDAALDDAVRLNAGWVRVDLSWASVQPASATEWDWSRFDRTVEAARLRKLEVLPILAYTPAWARAPGCAGDKCPPADVGAFAEFARRAAERYAPRGVHSWEVWNEQNTADFWSSGPDPVGYAGLLTATSAALRSADPEARVVMGGLAAVPTGAGRLDARTYLADVCRVGGCRAVQAVGYHPYTFPYLPSDTTAEGTGWQQIAATRRSLAGVLRESGLAEMPIWLTEYGAPTGGPGTVASGPGDASATTDHVTPERQAQIADDALAVAFRTPRVAALFWYAHRDDPAAASNVDFYGLRRVDGSAKPAWRSFERGAGRLLSDG